MRFNDAVLGVIIAVFGLFVLFESRSFPPMPGQSYGPGFFPMIIGGVMTVSGAILVIHGAATWRTTGFGAFGSWVRSPRHIINSLLAIGFLLVYILFDTIIGFIPLAFVTIAVLAYRFGTSLVASLVTALIATAIIHTVFYYLLAVQLPWGLLKPIAW